MNIVRKLMSLGFFYFCCAVALWLLGYVSPSLEMEPHTRPQFILFAWIVLSWFVDFDPYRWLEKIKPASADPPGQTDKNQAG